MKPDDKHPPETAADVTGWSALRAHTAARIGLGRIGASQSTGDVLRFALAHAQARDAVAQALDTNALAQQLTSAGWQCFAVPSAAPDRAVYLRRPDLGRRLGARARQALNTAAQATTATGPVHIAFVVADGLSAQAVQVQAGALLAAVRDRLPVTWTYAPVALATQARVALGDEVGQGLGADLVVVLIGERPGLSSPDSMGAYLTYQPVVGLPDSRRNCVSNIRPAGLAIEAGAKRLAWLMQAAVQRRLSGVMLKDGSEPQPVSTDPPPSLPAD